jgi:hypothetical protein
MTGAPTPGAGDARSEPVLVITRRTLRRVLVVLVAVFVVAGVAVGAFAAGRDTATRKTTAVDTTTSTTTPTVPKSAPSSTTAVTSTTVGVTTSTTTTEVTTTTAPLPLAVDCASFQVSVVPHFEPARFQLLCGGTAESEVYVQDIRWASWTDTSASGSGVFAENTCEPDCASGNFKYAATTITLSQPAETQYGLLFTRVLVPAFSATPEKIPG